MPAESTEPEAPRSFTDKFGAALPIALTFIATGFAGMSTSEMTQAMFWRASAAQDQSKSTNQWSLAGFKRDRSLIVQVAAANLRTAAGYVQVDVTLAPEANQDANQQAANWLNGKGPPRVDLPPPEDERLIALLTAIRKRESEADILKIAWKVKLDKVNEEIDKAEVFIEKTTEQDWDPVVKAAAAIVARSASEAADSRGSESERTSRQSRATALQAAGFELESRRYRGEAALNQKLGLLYEARVKVLTALSEQHKERSKNFFYAMLAAQVGATLASLGLARKRRSGLWALAGLSGLIAIAFGVYVYLGM